MTDTLQMMERIRKRREVMALMNAPDDPTVGEAVGKAFQDLYAGVIEKPAKNVLEGYKAGASGMYDLGANAMMLVNRGGDYLTEKTGVGAMSKDTAFGSVERWLRKAAQDMAPDAESLDDDVVSKIYQGLGAAPAAIAEYATGARALGTVGGFAAVDALRAAQEEPETIALEAAKGALMGGAFKGVEGLKRLPRTGALATLGGAAAAGEGGGPEDVTAGAATLGILGAFGAPGRVGLREIYRQPRGTRQYPQEQARQDVLELVERVREQGPPPTAPRPEAARPPAPAPVPVRPFQLPRVDPRPQISTASQGAKPIGRSSKIHVDELGGSMGLDVLINPTRNQVNGLANKAKSGELRVLRDPDNLDLLVWDAGRATHDQVSRSVLGKPYYETMDIAKLRGRSFGVDDPIFASQIAGQSIKPSHPVFQRPPAPAPVPVKPVQLPGIPPRAEPTPAPVPVPVEPFRAPGIPPREAAPPYVGKIAPKPLEPMGASAARMTRNAEILARMRGHPAKPAPEVRWLDLPPSVRRAVMAARGAEGERGIAWESHHGKGAAQVDAWLRKHPEHPLAQQAGSPHSRFEVLSREWLGKVKDVGNLSYKEDPFTKTGKIKTSAKKTPEPAKPKVPEKIEIVVPEETEITEGTKDPLWTRERVKMPRMPTSEAALEKAINRLGYKDKPGIADYNRMAKRLTDDAVARLEVIKERIAETPYGQAQNAAQRTADPRLRGEARREYIKQFMAGAIGREEIPKIPGKFKGAELSDIKRGLADGLNHRGAKPIPEVADIPFRLRTPDGRETRYTLKPDLEQIEGFQRRISGGSPTLLYTFPGPIAGITRAWRPVADRIIDTLAEHRYSPFARWMGGYPFKDPTMGKLPERAEYLGRRGEAQGEIYRFNRMANTLNNTLRRANETERMAIYEYLTTKGADPKGVPAAYRGAAVASKSTIKKIGRELVRRGLLSKEAYDKHADAYLPRVYLKFLLERSPFTTGLRKSEEGYLKQRIEDLPQEYRDLFLGEVRDPGFLVTKAVSVPARDLAMQDFLRDLTYNGNWVLPKSTVDWQAPGMARPRKVTPFWLKKESEMLRDRAGRMESPQARQRATAIADQMRDTADQALGALKGNVPKEYRQMPDSPRYGDLRGLVVRKEIFNDIVGQGQAWIGEKGFYDKTWDKLGTANAIWKMMKVPLNPPTQMRNFVSNGVLLHLSGVPMTRLPGLYARAMREIVRNGKHYRVAVKHGIPASTFAAEELVQIMPDILRVRGEKGGISGSLYKMAEPLARLTKAPGDLYQFSETWGKTVKIIDAMERQGMTERQAVAAAQEALFDYSLVPPLVKALRSRPIGAPFITFYYKAFPAVAKAAIRDPGKMAMYYLLPYVLGDALLANLRDVEPEDVDKLRQALPEWMREQGHTYVYPYKDESGRWTFTNFGYFLPWAMHERTLRSAYELGTGDYGGSVNDLFSEMGILGGPVPQVGAVLMTGIDPFTQRRVFEETDPPKEQLYKALTWAWQLAGPSWLSDRGVVGHVRRSLENEPNYYGDQPLSVPQALARGAGVNIYPVDPEASRGRNLRRMGFDIEEMRRAGRRAMRHPKLTDEKREDLRQQYREEMLEAIERLRGYEERSKVHPSLR